jgi:hypothetical protein
MYYRDCYVWINSDKTVRSESLRAELIVIGFWIICAFCSDRIGMLLVVRSIDLRRREDTSQEAIPRIQFRRLIPPPFRICLGVVWGFSVDVLTRSALCRISLWEACTYQHVDFVYYTTRFEKTAGSRYSLRDHLYVS